MIKVYQYSKCQTCRKALAWLDRKGVPYAPIPIVDQPPSRRELETMLKRVGELKRLFNTSGQLYRELKVSERLKTMTKAQALDLLARHGKLIKRPFVLAPKAGLVGFKEAEWEKALG